MSELLLKPSMPTHAAEYEPFGPVTVGTVH